MSLFGKHKTSSSPKRFGIEGMQTAPVTPKADDAETAAQALLEEYSRKPARRKAKKEPEKGTPAYYASMSEKIKSMHVREARDAMRYVAYAERMLALSAITSVASGTSLASLEQGLYEHMNTVNREGGELKARWQNCIAEITVRQLSSITDNT